MGALLDTPRTEKFNESGEGNNLRYGLSSMQGWRVSMEDSHCAITKLPGHLKEWSFFAVFDGHAGTLISEKCAAQLLKVEFSLPSERELEVVGSHNRTRPSFRLILQHIVDTEEFKKINPDLVPTMAEIKQGIREGFLTLDEGLRNLPEIANGKDKSGSTAICVLVTPNHIFFANCGDSRAMLIREGAVAFATTDHKPVHPAEKERIQNAGGSVIVQRVNGSLAVSRSLGDFSYKTVRGLGPTQQLISPEPEITVIDRQKDRDQVIVLACDGIWDVLSNEELCDMVNERMCCVGRLSKVCDEVLDYCLHKGSSDNMSLVLVAFETALVVDVERAAGDKRLEETIESMVHEYMKKEVPHCAKLDYVISHIRDNLQIELPGHVLHCKAGLVQRTLDSYKMSLPDRDEQCSPETNTPLSAIQQLFAPYRSMLQNPSGGLLLPESDVDPNKDSGEQNNSTTGPTD